MSNMIFSNFILLGTKGNYIASMKLVYNFILECKGLYRSYCDVGKTTKCVSISRPTTTSTQ